jgi:hypothetical protein
MHHKIKAIASLLWKSVQVLAGFPDHVVKPTIADKVRGQDPKLEYARKLIKL